MNGGAILDSSRSYRYRLWRRWDDGPLATWVMLNPSSADEQQDDPTLRRCIGFSRALHCGGLVVVNLFALRSKTPNDLRLVPDPIGPDNDRHIREAVAESAMVIAAWGSFFRALERSRAVAKMLGPNVWSFGTTKSGAPSHPLYLPSDARLEPYRAFKARTVA